jgi:hypothetical protein
LRALPPNRGGRFERNSHRKSPTAACPILFATLVIVKLGFGIVVPMLPFNAGNSLLRPSLASLISR